jgi:ABC-2 type transport system ATP-binding protein
VLIEVLRELDANGIVPMTLTVRQPSLDDVFLTLTGRHVEADPAPTKPELMKVGAA